MKEKSSHLEEEAETWWLDVDVIDLKQYACCPHLIYYRYTWLTIRPLALAIQADKESHRAEAPPYIASRRARLNRLRVEMTAIRQSLQTESLPGPTAQQRRCPLCEFRRCCNDGVRVRGRGVGDYRKACLS